MSQAATLTRFLPRTAAMPGPMRTTAAAFRRVLIPVLGILAFLALWSLGASRVDTSLGRFPGPVAVWQQFGALYGEHRAERAKEAAFYERQERRNAERLAAEPGYDAKIRAYTGKETFVDQVITSLKTVLSGFTLGALVAIPFGIGIGLSRTLNAAVTPAIQLLRPISPLAWLPLVTMVVSALYATPDPAVPKSFVTSMITVTLCCVWPMIINTAVGVAAIDRDLVNVSRVLSLGPLAHVRRIVLPASVPMIFTGMRLSIGIAWMVLIAAEMLAQNPGLGKFVWDEFQNGSSESLSRILAAAIVIGFIGVLLDRAMLFLQRYASWDEAGAAR